MIWNVIKPCIPNAEGVVHLAPGHQFVVWQEGDEINFLAFSGKLAQLFAAGDVPDNGAVILTTGCQVLTIWGERYHPNGVRVADKLLNFASRVSLPKPYQSDGVTGRHVLPI